GPGPRIFIRQQRHRRDRIRPVAILARALKDWRYIFRERNLSRLRSNTAASQDYREQRYKNDRKHKKESIFQQGFHADVSSLRMIFDTTPKISAIKRLNTA